MLNILKSNATTDGNFNVLVHNIKIESYNFVIDEAIKFIGDKWIPTSECLPSPQIFGNVLCCDKYGNYMIAFSVYKDNDSYSAESDEGLFMYDVVAWQPLPKAYKE